MQTQVAQHQPPQRQLPGMLGAVRKPAKVDDALLRTCASELDAIHLCVHLAKLPHYAIAERLGIDKGHWTRMMQGQAHFPTNKITALQRLCGNWAVLQWQNREAGFEMFEDAKAQRREELMRELEQLNAA
jgi:hypothetical protein